MPEYLKMRTKCKTSQCDWWKGSDGELIQGYEPQDGCSDVGKISFYKIWTVTTGDMVWKMG